LKEGSAVGTKGARDKDVVMKKWIDSSLREMRRARRYRLSKMITFSFERGDGTVSRMVGITQDVSMNGISFAAASDLKVGDPINLDFFLVAASRTSQEIRLHADGVVRRIDRVSTKENQQQIAAEIAFQEDPDEMFFATREIQ
jgi:hypothetical protein